jgi:predicted small lipoprotein YifL
MVGSRLRRNGDNMARIARNLVLALSVALVLAACGRKSDLQKPLPPPDVQKDPKNPKAADPDRPFILDPLLH